MAVGVIVFIVLIITVVAITAMLPYGTGFSTFMIIGIIAGMFTVLITVGFILLCSRRHRNVNTKEENGFEIQAVGVITPGPKVSATSNTYVKSNDSSSLCRNVPPLSQQRQISTSSEYTESHYYTEIDEYFINKRIAKQQHKKSHQTTEDHTLPQNSNQMDNSSYTYDYAYCQFPQK